MKKLFLLIILMGFIFSCVSLKHSSKVEYLPMVNDYIDIDDFYITGMEYLRAGKPDAAIENFRQSVVVDEYLFVAYGYSYIAKRVYNIAQRNFQNALEINPDNKDAQIGLLIISQEVEERAKIFYEYSKLMAKYPEDEWIKNKFEEIKKEGKEYYLKQADEVYGNQSREEEYIQNLKKAEIYITKSDPINLKIAKFYEEKDHLALSVKYFEKFLSEDQNNVKVMRELAEIYERMDKYDEALLTYKRIQIIDPDNLKLEDKISEIKELLYESDLPQKFKNIFFKDFLTREDLAALIGYYFERYLLIEGNPKIISDISDSFARDYIIRVCSNKIIKLRPDHSFDLYKKVGRADFSNTLNNLIKYLENKGFILSLTVSRDLQRPTDISTEHRSYSVILLLINLGIMDVDENGRFNPTLIVKPYEAMSSLKKILNEIKD